MGNLFLVCMSRDTSELKCRLLWKLCRRHGWATPVPRKALVDWALQDSDQGRGRTIVEDLLDEPYIGFQRGAGYSVRNDPDSQAQAAYRLKSVCGYTELQIEATLSRFQQAGGFAAYGEDDVLKTLKDW